MICIFCKIFENTCERIVCTKTSNLQSTNVIQTDSLKSSFQGFFSNLIILGEVLERKSQANSYSESFDKSGEVTNEGFTSK